MENTTHCYVRARCRSDVTGDVFIGRRPSRFPVEIFSGEIAKHCNYEKRRENVEFDGGTEIEAVGERHDETQRLPQTIVGKRRLRLATEQRAV